MSIPPSFIARLAFIFGCVFAVGVHAESLKIGLASEPTAIDPHYHNLSTNNALAEHIFETLVSMSPEMATVPSLAESWKAIDDLTWEFKLRPQAKFSNGEPFTSKDVVFTMCRVLNNETAGAGGFATVVKHIVKMETPDANTVRLITATPYPVLPNQLATVSMIWSGLAPSDNLTYDPEAGCGVKDWPAVSDFNSGRAVIGTGPYILKSFVKGSVIELTRNDAYWGEKPHWESVRMVPVPAAGPRLTGLLTGEFDLIESPAARDLKRVQSSGFDMSIKPSARVIYLQLDTGRNQSPQVKSPKGDNPLQDVRVRQAMSMAIDRKAIVARVMDGVATPAYQFLPDGMFGTLKRAPELKYDPVAAKALLVEAGYPDGFELTLTGPNDRYINDAQIVQAVAQYLARIGIKANVDTMTRSVYFSRRAKRDFSASLGGWVSDSGEGSHFIQYQISTTDPSSGMGSNNYGGYSNPKLDRIFLEAMRTMDDTKRAELINQSIVIALEDMPHIPLHFENGVWAFRKGYAYEGRADQHTLATSFRPVK